MQMKIETITDCLNLFDNMILYNIENIDSTECLENMRGYFFDDYFKRSDEELVVIKSILSQINLITNIFYLLDDYCITDYYYDLRERLLDWLKACHTKLEIDEQQ